MIDLKAARADPESWRAALARKNAGEAFDELLAADETWRALVPRVDDLRSRTKLKGKPTPEQLEELQRMKEDLRRAEERASRSRGGARRCARTRPQPSAPVGAGRRHRGRRAGDPPCRRAARTHRPEGGERDRPVRARAGSATLGLALRVSRRGHGTSCTRALPLRTRSRCGRGLHAGAATRPRARGVDDRHRLLPHREVEHLRARAGRPLPHRDVRGRTRGDAHVRDPRGRRAAAAIRRLLHLLPPRSGRRGQGHARNVPRAPVQQGRDVRLHDA